MVVSLALIFIKTLIVARGKDAFAIFYIQAGQHRPLLARVAAADPPGTLAMLADGLEIATGIHNRMLDTMTFQ